MDKLYNFRLLLIILIFLASCQSPVPEQHEFLTKVESAHRKPLYEAKQAVAYELVISMKGKKIWQGEIMIDSDGDRIRMSRQDGTQLFYDGAQVYQYPSYVDYEKARFDIFTWSYFFSLPFKLSDPGTRLEKVKNTSLNEREFQVRKLTFSEGVGDSPDDWYNLYVDPETDLLFAAAYIVTYGKSKEEAEKDPHAIVYQDYEIVAGIPVSTRWEFWQWREGRGLTNPLGEAILSNIRFFEPVDEMFSVPPSARPVNLE